LTPIGMLTMTAPDIDLLQRQVTDLEQRNIALQNQLKERERELNAARAANREPISALNKSLSDLVESCSQATVVAESCSVYRDILLRFVPKHFAFSRSCPRHWPHVVVTQGASFRLATTSGHGVKRACGSSCLRRTGLGVACRFLDELNARGEAELGVHVGEVGLYGTRRYEQPCGDVLVAEAFRYEAHDVALGRRQRTPPARRSFPFGATTLCVGDGVL
jgi:hypothetical protein